MWPVLAVLLAMLPAVSSAQGTCLAGSGTCSDGFSGPAGTVLTAYSSSWIKIKGTSDAYLTASGSVTVPGRTYAYYAYAPSSSDTSQILVQASRTTNAYAREACVRMTSGLGGYCVGFGSVSGGNYYGCYVEKGGSYLGNASCGAISATSDHTLAIVASGTAKNVSLNVYVDNSLTGTVTDQSDLLTDPKSGFALIGDGDASNTQLGSWQDSQGTLSSAEALVAVSPVFGCTNGSGTCFDTFSGVAGKLLPQYNGLWTKAKGTSDAYLTGTKSIQIPGATYVYYLNEGSVSDTSQITVNPSAATQPYAREACVRMQKNVGGYCVGFSGVTNGYYTGCYIEKGGSYQGNPNCGVLSATIPHTLSIVASGVLPVVLQVYADGIPMRALSDFINTYQARRSGFGLIGDGYAANTDAGTWRDYREAVVATAPTFSPAAGSYSSAQTVSMISSTAGAVIHFTLDGSTPTALSPVYTGAMKVVASTTVKAIAMVAGQTTSAVATSVYQINLPVLSAPIFTVPSPFAGVATNVGILSTAAGSQVLYCIDTSNTCTPGTPYVSPIRFATTGYIRALATLSGYAPSAIAVWKGTWSAAQIVTSSCPEGTQYKVYAGCTITVSGGLPPYIFGWSTSGDNGNNGLVEGLKLNPVTGAITGTVYGQGVYSVPFTVTDGTNSTVTKVVTMPMRADNTTAGCSLFPADSIWHLNVSSLPVDNSPAAPILPDYLNSSLHLVFGKNLSDGGIPFLKVPYNQPNVPVSTTVYQSYFTSAPFPSYAPVESTQNAGPDADRHVAVVQAAGGGNHCKLWELWQGAPTSTGWTASSNAYWDLESYDMLPQDNGSTDAAGLPITPLLWNYDEVAGTCGPGAECGVVKHPARLTLNHTLHYHVWPATAQSGLGYCTGGYKDDNRLLSQSNPPTFCSGSSPMGEIYRMKKTTAAPAACVGHPQAQVLITALRNYGFMITDNGITGGIVATADSRWNDDDLACLTAIKLSDFEPVNVSGKMIDVNSSQVRP